MKMIERSQSGWFTEKASTIKKYTREYLQEYLMLTVWIGTDKDDDSRALLIAPDLPARFRYKSGEDVTPGGGHCLIPDTMVCLGTFSNAQAWRVFMSHNRMLESTGEYE